MYEANIESAVEKFRALLTSQLARVEDMKAQGDFTDYTALRPLRIGICGGDGIGPIISAEAERVLRFILADKVADGSVEFVPIEGLTLENRIAHKKGIPDDVMAELRSCPIILNVLDQRSSYPLLTKNMTSIRSYHLLERSSCL